MITSNPLISIIIPVYNQETKIKRAIESAINQIYKRIELVIIDDGSTDNSKKVIDQYIKKDKRIKYFYKTNGGLVDATIYGITHAHGDYVCFLDSDDEIGNDFVNNFIKYGENDDDIVAMGWYFVSESKSEPYILKECYYKNLEVKNLGNNYLFDKYLFCTSRCNKMFKREIARNVADEMGKYKHISIGEDSLFCFFSLRYAKSVRTLKTINSYYYYVSDNNSMMHSLDTKFFWEQCKKLYEVLYENMDNVGYNVEQALLVIYQASKSIYMNNKYDRSLFIDSHEYLKKDSTYNLCLDISAKHLGLKDNVMILLKKFFPSSIFFFIYRKLG